MSERQVRSMAELLVACVVVVGLVSAQGPAAEKPPWQRLLQGDDARKARELDERVEALRQAGKFAEALESAEALARLRAARQGKEHWESMSAHFEVEAIRRAISSGKKDREDYAGGFALASKAAALEQKGRYKEALALREQVPAICHRVLGEEHPHTAASYSWVAFNLHAQGRYKEAEEGFRKALDICRKVLGEDHPLTAGSYNGVASNQHAQGRYKEAEEGYQKALEIFRKVFGEDHPHTATCLNNVAFNLNAQGRYKEAEEGVRKALEIRRKVLGEEHPDTAQSYNNVATNLNARGRYQEAEEGFNKALTIRRKVLGEGHPDTAQSYNNLAFNLSAQGRYKKADEGFRKALDTYRKVAGEEHPETAAGYNNVAFNLNAQGRYQEAEMGYRKALDIFREVLGEEHPSTATCYNNVASNLSAQGRHKEAEEGFKKALDIRRKVLGEEHPDTANTYNSVAYNLGSQDRYKEAEAAHKKALDIHRKVLGEDHPDTAQSYNNLAFNLSSQGRCKEAEEGYQKALDIRRKVLGEEHPHTAASYNNVAFNLDAQGRYQEAEEGIRKALSIRRKVLGEEHPDTALSYSNVAINLNARGKYKEAEGVYGRAAEAFLASRLQIAASGLGRATTTGERSPLLRLAAVLARNGKPAAAWQCLEQSLGRGTWDDLSARLHRPAKDTARQAELTAQLQRLDELLLRDLAIRESGPQQQQQCKDLLERRLKGQEQLARFTHYLEETYGPAAGKVFSRQTVQATLPADTALLAWIDLSAGGPKAADPDGEHWAVVLRARGEPIFERLHGGGPGGAWTDDDTRLPADLRTALEERRGGWQRLAQRLRQQRLAPVAERLAAADGLPAVRRLIVLPSTALAGVPVEVFADSYTVSYVPSGTVYTHLHQQPKVTSNGLLALADPTFDLPARKDVTPPPLPERGVLLTAVLPGSNAAKARLRPNDVLLRYHDTDLTGPADFKPLPPSEDPAKEVAVTYWRDGRTFETRLRPGKLGVVLAKEPAPKALAEQRERDRRFASLREEKWARLPGTRIEAEALRRLFDDGSKPEVLQGSQASEQRLHEMAKSGALGGYRYVHLATHGEVDHDWPLRSAVLLARDNLPDPGKQLDAGLPVFDAKLTAAEVVQEWDLHCELVTLSACQSALGKYERGEGFVGFAQAFLLCGSRSVCLSLWPVDDAATALLMQRFYQNLLGKREGLKSPLGKAAALAEAKLWLSQLSADEALKLAAGLRQGLPRSKNASARESPGTEKPTLPKEARPYAHPYYWAAFILIGDPD